MSSLATAEAHASAAPAKIIQPGWVRTMHWINALAMIVMIMSGWQIYNASPLFSFTFSRNITLGGWLAGALAWLRFSSGKGPPPPSPTAPSATAAPPIAVLQEQPPAPEQPPPPREPKKFLHPGLLHTEADLARMKAKVAAGAQPWLDDWKLLTASPLAQLGFRPRPAELVVRGQGVRGPNIMLLTQSAHAAYLCAVRWKVSGDEAYAKKALDIMNAWSGAGLILPAFRVPSLLTGLSWAVTLGITWVMAHDNRGR